MNFRAYGGPFSLEILVLLLVVGIDGGATVRAQGPSPMAIASSVPPQHLSAEGEAALRGFIDAGNFTDLRWPNFVEYEDQVKSFYDSGGYALVWLQGGQPT